MWPLDVPWDSLSFGVEIEFVEADSAMVTLVPGWTMDRTEQQRVLSGAYSGGEAKPGKLTWAEREQIGAMFEAIADAGGEVNWSCGLHVHVGLEPWSFDIVGPLVDAALATQGALRELLHTAEHRGVFTPRQPPLLVSAARRGLRPRALRSRRLSVETVRPEHGSTRARRRPRSHRPAPCRSGPDRSRHRHG